MFGAWENWSFSRALVVFLPGKGFRTAVSEKYFPIVPRGNQTTFPSSFPWVLKSLDICHFVQIFDKPDKISTDYLVLRRCRGFLSPNIVGFF